MLNTLNMQNIVNKVSSPSVNSKFKNTQQKDQQLISNPINEKDLNMIQSELMADLNAKDNFNNFKDENIGNNYNQSEYQSDYQNNINQEVNFDLNNYEMGMDEFDEKYTQNFDENDIEISNNKSLMDN